MSTKLTSKDSGIIVVVILISAISLAISVKYFWRAFPEASIEFKVSREDSTRLAERFLSERGFRPDGYRHASIFDYDETAKLYLEKALGLERLNELARAGGKIRIWRWSHRWFKPLEKEELRVQVTPAGEIAGFSHELLETAPGGNLEPAAARPIAEQFLSNMLGRNLAELDFLEAAEEKRPARTDHVLTWTDKAVDLGDGSQRVEVTVSGDQVSGYREYIHIPEGWMRDYRELRSRNESAQVVDEVLWILLSVAMLVFLIRRLRIHDVPVRLSLAFGAVAAVLVFLDYLNTFSLAQFNYSTADTYSGFVAGYMLQAVLAGLGIGIGIFLIVASSEPIYRESFPQLASIGSTFTWRGLRSRSFFMANVIGIGLTFFFFAYQTVFYLAANKLGAWAPSDVPFSDQLNTAIPWVAVLFGGFAPAVLEEMQFRTFAIPFFRRALRSWPAAIIVTAFIWGFLHSAYPNQPFFIRGVEVGVGGLLVGILMLRFGVIATMIWHYSVDALYTAFILLRSSNLYLKFSGALAGGIMLIPLAIALIAYLRTGAFSDESSISNAASPPPQAPEEVPVSEPPRVVDYTPLDSKNLALAGVLILVMFALALAPAARFGEDIKIAVSKEQATQAAGEFLMRRNVSTGGYRNVAWLNQNVDPDAVKYLLEHVSVQEADRIYKQATKLLLWNVRYFRPLEKEEHSVFVDVSTGEILGHRHLLDENAPGASLESADARRLAEEAVAEHGYTLADFELESSQAQKRKAREDYTFIWQAKAGDPRNVAEERYRIQVEIAGDQIVGFNRFFKLPEEWLRRRDSSGIVNAILTGVLMVFVAGLLAGLVILFVGAVRSGRIRWAASGKIGLVAGIGAAIDGLGQMATMDRGYDTSIPLSTFHAFQGIGVFLSGLLVGLTVWVLVGLATALFPETWDMLNARVRGRWPRDAIITTVLSVAAIAGMGQLAALLTNSFHATAPVDVEIVPALLDAYVPGITIFVHGIVYAIGLTAALAVIAYMGRAGWRRQAWWFWLGVALLLVVLGPDSAHSVAEYFDGWIIRFIPFTVAAIIIVVFFKNNVLAYVTAALSFMVTSPTFSLFRQPLAFYRWNGLVLFVLVVVCMTWLLQPRAAGASPDS